MNKTTVMCSHPIIRKKNVYTFRGRKKRKTTDGEAEAAEKNIPMLYYYDDDINKQQTVECQNGWTNGKTETNAEN